MSTSTTIQKAVKLIEEIESQGEQLFLEFQGTEFHTTCLYNSIYVPDFVFSITDSQGGLHEVTIPYQTESQFIASMSDAWDILVTTQKVL